MVAITRHRLTFESYDWWRKHSSHVTGDVTLQTWGRPLRWLLLAQSLGDICYRLVMRFMDFLQLFSCVTIAVLVVLVLPYHSITASRNVIVTKLLAKFDLFDFHIEYQWQTLHIYSCSGYQKQPFPNSLTMTNIYQEEKNTT